MQTLWNAYRGLIRDTPTPSYGPLLATNESTTLRRRRQLRDVDGYLCGTDTNSKPVDYAACNEHSDILRNGRYYAPDDPCNKLVNNEASALIVP